MKGGWSCSKRYWGRGELQGEELPPHRTLGGSQVEKEAQTVESPSAIHDGGDLTDGMVQEGEECLEVDRMAV